MICAGSDLTTVQRKLKEKYIHFAAHKMAGRMAEQKAVEEYRRRFPRIDEGRF